MFGTVSLVFLAPVSPCAGEIVLSFEPLILRPYETALVQNGSCLVGKVLKVTGAIRGVERRNACVSIGRRAGLSTQTTGEAPTQYADELETAETVFQRRPTMPHANARQQ
jgi:hypothetical protein